ncbi:MAG: hypothetical protein ABW039_13720 [Sphingobium sp.]
MIDRGDTLFLVRTHYVDEGLLSFLRAMRAGGYDVAILLDATSDADAPDDIPVIPLARPAIEALGLFLPDDFAWRCGDYGLYLALQAYPGKSHFWMIEPDVLVHSRDPAGFFDRFLALDAALLCGCLREASPKWYWSASMAPTGLTTWRLLYSLVRISADGLRLMQAKRTEMSRGWAGPSAREDRRWPNDEALTGTVLHHAGTRCIDFNAIGPRPFYAKRSFTFDKPLSRSRIESMAPDDRLYHPVLGGERFAAKVGRMVSEARQRHSFGSLRLFNARVLGDFAREVGLSRALGMAAAIIAGQVDALIFKAIERLLPTRR